MVITALGAGVGRSEERSVWPHEQQARLRVVEDQVVHVQRELFGARQRQDVAAIEDLNEQLKELQQERVQLIRATRNQLPSD
ncbi:MAG: hypothetical protein AB7V27_14120 [Candidatus Binatia bacterium]